MDTTSFEQTIRCQYDSFSKAVLRNEARNDYKEMRNRKKHETSLEYMTESELEQLVTTDTYRAEEFKYRVLGHDVYLTDERLAAALNTLPERKRNVLLLAYFLDMTDKEIGGALDIGWGMAQYLRTTSLALLKKILEGSMNVDETN